MAVPLPGPAAVTRRSGVVWVALDGGEPRAVWHLWHGDCAWVLCGPGEQELPGAVAARRDGGVPAVVTVRHKESQGGQASVWEARATAVLPGTAAWGEVVPLLTAKRLNATDPSGLADRWAQGCLLVRLAPIGPAHGGGSRT